MTERAEHTAFTSGPWKVGGEWPQLVAIYDQNGIYIAHAETGVGRDWIKGNPIGDDRAKANARLIAASPDLLAALIACQKSLAMMIEPKSITSSSPQCAWSSAVAAETKARAAIFRATGEA
jgi:hypothetical protein